MINVIDAVVDEVFVYNRTLDVDEITAMQGAPPCAQRYAGDGRGRLCTRGRVIALLNEDLRFQTEAIARIKVSN